MVRTARAAAPRRDRRRGAGCADQPLAHVKDPDFYLGPHRPQLVDRNGNAGTTAWVDGRVVGCWVQDAAGTVEVRLVEPVPATAARALDDEAARLTAWLGGTRAATTVPSPAMRAPTWP